MRDKKRFQIGTEECLECKHYNYLLIWIKLYSREDAVRERVLGFILGHIFVYPFIESMTFILLVKGCKGC